MAKDKEEKSSDLEMYKVTAEQFYAIRKARKNIPCTLSSDIGLGGGIPLGSTVVVGGKPKAGKTTYVLQNAANAQRLYGSDVFFFPIEGRLTNQTMEQIQGLDKNKVFVIMPPAIKKGGEIIGHQKWYAEQWFSAIGKTILDNRNAILIVDSIANMSSEREVTGGIGTQTRGEAQKVESQFCRIYGDAIIQNNNTVFFITQIQANTSGYGPALQMKCGNHIKHQADVVLFCKSTEKWAPEGSTGKINGHDINMTVETSGIGPPYVDIEIPLRFGYGIDKINDVINHAVTWGYIKKDGAWYTVPFSGENNDFIEEIPAEIEKIKEIGLYRFQGKEKLWYWFADQKNAKALDQLENAIRKKILG